MAEALIPGIPETRRAIQPTIDFSFDHLPSQNDPDYEAKMKSAFASADPVEVDNRAREVLKNGQTATGPNKVFAQDFLRQYSAFKEERGEEPFALVEQADARAKAKSMRERVPFFAALTKGPQVMDQAFSEKDRPTFQANLGKENDQTRIGYANRAIVSSYTGIAPDKLTESWPTYRNRFAQQVFGATKPVDDAGFYAAANQWFSKEDEAQKTTSRVASLARQAAVQGQPISEGLVFAMGTPGADPKKHADVVHSAYASVYENHSDSVIQVARGLAELAMKNPERPLFTEATVIEPTGKGDKVQADPDEVKRQYASLSVQDRDKALGLAAAQIPEWNVNEFSARLQASFIGGAERVRAGMSSAIATGDADRYDLLLKRGVTRLSPEETMIPGAIAREEDDIRRDKTLAELAAKKDPEVFRELSKGEIAALTKESATLRARATWEADLGNMPLRADQYRTRIDDGFWTKAGVTIAGSVPEMMQAAAPYGIGLAMLYTQRKALNYSEFERSAPGASKEQIEQMAGSSALIQTALDRFEMSLLGGNLPVIGGVIKNFEAGLTKSSIGGTGRFVGGMAARIAGATVFETGQEVAQDLSSPFVQQVFAAAAKDVPGPDWGAVYEREKEAMGDIFAASCVFSLVAGGGRSFGQRMEISKLRNALMNTDEIELAGFDNETAKNIARTAVSDPLAAADALKAAADSTPVETRKANSEAKRAALEAEVKTLPTVEDAMLPTWERNENGTVTVNFPDRPAIVVDTPELALEEQRRWEGEHQVNMEAANRDYIAALSGMHEKAQTGIEVEGETETDTGTLSDWAGTSQARINVAYARARFSLREAGLDAESFTDEDIDLKQFPIIGKSRNQYGAGVTKIAMEIGKGGNPLTVIQEHAEGVSKHLLNTGRVTDAQMIQWIRQTEAATGTKIMADNIATMDEDVRSQEIHESFSRVAVANATGRIADSSLPQTVRGFFKAMKETILAVLTLAKGIADFRASGKMDEEFGRYLDLAAGIDESVLAGSFKEKAETDLAEESGELVGETFSVTASTDAIKAAIDAKRERESARHKQELESIKAAHPDTDDDEHKRLIAAEKKAHEANLDALKTELTNARQTALDEAFARFNKDPEAVAKIGAEMQHKVAEVRARADKAAVILDRQRGDAQAEAVEAEKEIFSVTDAKLSEMEIGLAAIDEKRDAENERHQKAKDKIRADGNKATEDAREALVGELGNRWMEATGKERQTLNRVMRERTDATKESFNRDLKDENKDHRANLQALAKEEAALRKQARESETDEQAKLRKQREKAKAQQGAFDEQQQRFEQLRDIATLEAIGKSLPKEIRGSVISGFHDLAELRTPNARAKYLTDLLGKIETVLDRHMQKTYRAAIKKQLKKGEIKMSEARTRGGKIGATGHDIYAEVKTAMRISDDPEGALGGKTAAQKASDQADGYMALIEAPGDLTREQIESLDGKMGAVQLFYDYDNAETSRLSKGLEFLQQVYVEGRKDWIDTLMGRRELRDSRVKVAITGLGLSGGKLTDQERNAARAQGEGRLHKISEGIMGALLSGWQTIKRLSEDTDSSEFKQLTNDLEWAALQAEAMEADGNAKDNETTSKALQAILGVKSSWGMSSKLKELTKTGDNVPVRKVEGRAVRKVSVPLSQIETALNGDLDSLKDGGEKVSQTLRDMTAQDIVELEAHWEAWNQQSKEQKGKARNLTYEVVESEGERLSIGKISQLEGMQLWLTMRQADQFAKLEKMGYDQETMDELESWLKPETKAIGLWLVDYLKSDQGSIDTLHRFEKGVGLGLIANYFPVRNEVSGADNEGLSIYDTNTQQAGRSAGFIKERVGNQAPPAYVNGLAIFFQHRAQANFWKSHVGFVREWGGLLRDERFAAAVKNKLGATYYKNLMRRLERIESGGNLNARQQTDFERVVKSMVRNYAAATLGLRLSTLMVNASAALNVAMEIPAPQIIKGMLQAIKRPESFKDAFNSPVIQRRLRDGSSFEAQLVATGGVSKSPIMTVFNKMAEKSMVPINWVDTGSQIFGAAAVWEFKRNEALASDLSEAQAREYADEAVERVFARAAQPTTKLGKSELEMRVLDNPLAAFFALFVSEPRKNFAITYLAGRELLTGKGQYGKPMAAQQMAMTLVALPVIEYVIRSFYQAFAKAKDDEEDELFARWWKRMSDGKAWGAHLSTGNLKGIPIYGQGWEFAMNEAWDQQAFNTSPNPLIRAADSSRKIQKAFEDGDSTRDAVKGMTKAAQGAGAVIPGGAFIAQAANAVEAVEGISRSSQILVSDADRADRIKGQFNAFSKDLDEKYGPTTKDTGKLDKDGEPIKKTDKEVKRAKDAAKADWIRNHVVPEKAEVRKEAVKKMNVSDDVKKLIR